MPENKTTPANATVFIVDDNEELSNALALNLRSEGYQVKTYKHALDFLEQYNPDTLGCLLLDVRMPGMTGDELQKELLNKNISIPIIFMSGYSDVPVAVDTLKHGALDFLTKPIDQYTLVKSINFALQTDIQNRKKAEQNKEVLDNAASLTKREHEVMELIVKGKLNKIIADELNISINTVENHRSNLMHKMNAKTIADLVCMCLLNNLVEVEKEETA